MSHNLKDLLYSVRSPYYSTEGAFREMNKHYRFYDDNRARSIIRTYKDTYSNLQRHSDELFTLIDTRSLSFRAFCKFIESKDTTLNEGKYDFNRNLRLLLQDKVYQDQKKKFDIRMKMNTAKDSNIPRNLYNLKLYLDLVLEEPAMIVTDYANSYLYRCYTRMDKEVSKFRKMYPEIKIKTAVTGIADGDSVKTDINDFRLKYGESFLLLDYYSNKRELYRYMGLTRVIRLEDV